MARAVPQYAEKELENDVRGCVVVVERGIENLTVAPRTVAEVEAVMRGDIKDSAALLAWRTA